MPQSLKNSGNFANTHAVIDKMIDFNWSLNQKEQIFNIAMNNRQVKLILKDKVIKKFYQKLLDNYLMPGNSDADEIRKIIGKR